MTSSQPTSTPALRDTRRAFIAPVLGGAGRLYVWFPDLVSQSKVVQYLTKHSFRYQLADGNCVLVDAAWERLRDVAIPLRRVLTQYESDDARVLFKSDGGDLTTADFPRVHSFTHFSLASQTSFLHDLLDGRRLTTVYQPIVHAALSGQVTGRVFINVSPVTAQDPVEAVDSTLESLQRAQMPPDRIVFEVTEADHALDTETLRRVLASYRAAGFGVALDDVGAGYSSLNMLHQLRPDYIKLDMELIRNVHADGYKALIAQKILEIARSLGVRTVAEGVETAEELAWVCDHGAGFVQGYLIARPGEPRFPVAA